MSALQGTHRRIARATIAAMTLGLLVVAATGVHAERRGRGLTANLEVNFLKTTIDHHFAALRMTDSPPVLTAARRGGDAPRSHGAHARVCTHRGAIGVR